MRISLSEKVANANIQVEIPELKIKQNLTTDSQASHRLLLM